MWMKRWLPLHHFCHSPGRCVLSFTAGFSFSPGLFRCHPQENLAFGEFWACSACFRLRHSKLPYRTEGSSKAQRKHDVKWLRLNRKTLNSEPSHCLQVENPQHSLLDVAFMISQTLWNATYLKGFRMTATHISVSVLGPWLQMRCLVCLVFMTSEHKRHKTKCIMVQKKVITDLSWEVTRVGPDLMCKSFFSNNKQKIEPQEKKANMIKIIMIYYWASSQLEPGQNVRWTSNREESMAAISDVSMRWRHFHCFDFHFVMLQFSQ